MKASLIAGGAWVSGFDKITWSKAFQNRPGEVFSAGKQIGVVGFTEESTVPMEKVFGAELDGRSYTDLSALTPENPVTPSDRFYIRTRASQILPDQQSWSLRVGGLVEKSFSLSAGELRKSARAMGQHLMECAGNARSIHFGLMSVGDWAGTPVEEVLDGAKMGSQAARVLISGFDRYATRSVSSIPGASWIFRREELQSAGAFLATSLNGRPITQDHGAPVRLIVPGWYGCSCIKWVDEITLVDDDAPATSQMKEYAARTLQTGVPQLARDFHPAVMEQAAMPIRVEKWQVDEKIAYRVVGLLWGGSQLIKILEIRFNPEEEFVPVDQFQQTGNDPWSFWTHAWKPSKPGAYLIRLRVKDPFVSARRMDARFYVRSVEITDV
ncbi:MAG: molybdopterin-dependent oxidoreductase [Candidatus Acidiferrales bacterium]